MVTPLIYHDVTLRDNQLTVELSVTIPLSESMKQYRMQDIADIVDKHVAGAIKQVPPLLLFTKLAEWRASPNNQPVMTVQQSLNDFYGDALRPKE